MPLFRVGEWAEEACVTDYYGVTAEELNDDRLGRALERLNKHGQAVQAVLVANADFQLMAPSFLLEKRLPLASVLPARVDWVFSRSFDVG